MAHRTPAATPASGLLGSRVFTADDQHAFAALSGDANPVHVDPVAARRTVFGGCVVHGVHGLVWALDRLAAVLDGARTLRSLSVTFAHAIRPGETVRGRVLHCDDDAFAVQLESGSLVVTRVSGRWGHASAGLDIPPEGVRLECRERTFEQATTATGRLPLWLDRALSRQLFPAWLDRWPGDQLAVLLATTRLVGMECPGLHSLFHAITLDFGAAVSGTTLAWRAREVDARFASLAIDVEGPGVSGTLSAFVRPRPIAQRSYLAIARESLRGEFSGHRVLVIGGSRGLGELTAKVAAARGASVCLTYAAGARDAARVAGEIQAGGGSCIAIPWDVTSSERPALPWRPTAACYFATPRITSDRGVVFSEAQFSRFVEFYVFGFRRLVEHVMADRGSRAMSVLYPSTTFLDRAVPHMAEYCAAKAAGEELCRQLARRFPSLRLLVPRLPRLATDQTAGISSARAPAPDDVLVPLLRDLCRPQASRSVPSRRRAVPDVRALGPLSLVPLEWCSLVPVL